MWVGAIRLEVATKDAPDAGTDSRVLAVIVRDGTELLRLALDYPDEDDLEAGADRFYRYTNLPWINDETPPLPDGVGQSPMPYPDYGIEFSGGLKGHLRVRLRIGGSDMWIKDFVKLSIREIREVATSFDTFAWREDTQWKYLGSWPKDVALSTDSDEGYSVFDLKF